MGAVQGPVLSGKFKHLDRWTESRRLLAERYRKLLAGLPIQLPAEAPARRHVWHLFVSLHPERDRIRRELEARGILSSLHYPVPIHLQKAYRHLGHRPGDFPVTEKIARECLTLPLFPEMTAPQQDRVIEALHEILGRNGPG